MFFMCHMQYLLQLERSDQKGRKYQLHISSLIVEACEIIYVFFSHYINVYRVFFCDFDETTKNYIL